MSRTRLIGASASEISKHPSFWTIVPFFGVLLSHSTHSSSAVLSASNFTVRCAEAEFGFEMGADVPESPMVALGPVQHPGAAA